MICVPQDNEQFQQLLPDSMTVCDLSQLTKVKYPNTSKLSAISRAHDIVAEQ